MTFEFGWFAMGRSGSVPLARASAANLPCVQEDVAYDMLPYDVGHMLRGHMGAASNVPFCRASGLEHGDELVLGPIAPIWVVALEW